MHSDESNTPGVLPDPSNRRRHGRICAKELKTRLGNVADLSASGMRVICRNPSLPPDGSVLHLELRHPDGYLPVKARIVWEHRRSETEHELGLVFEDVSPSVKAGLVAMARLALQSMSAEMHHVQSDSDD